MMNIDALMKANNGNISAVTENIIKTEDPWYIIEYLRDMSGSISINDIKKILHALENIYINNECSYIKYGYTNSFIDTIFKLFENKSYYSFDEEIIDMVIDIGVKLNNPDFIADSFSLIIPMQWLGRDYPHMPLSKKNVSKNLEKIMGALGNLNSPKNINCFCNDFGYNFISSLSPLDSTSSINKNHFSNFTRIMVESGTPEEITEYMFYLKRILNSLEVIPFPLTKEDFISSIDIESLANVVANSDDPNLVSQFAGSVSLFYDQKVISEGIANKFAKIMLKSQQLDEICDFITLCGIGNQLSSDVLSKLIDKIIELSSMEGKIEHMPFIYITKCYRIINVGKIRKEDLCKINDHILKIGNLDQIIEHAYFNMHLMQDKDKKNITEKIITSKNAKAIYTYITCWNKQGDLKLSAIYYYEYNIYTCWKQKPSPLKEEEVLNLMKALINVENISIDSQDCVNLQIVSGLIEKSNDYAEFSSELNKFTVTSKGKLKIETESEENKKIDSNDVDKIVIVKEDDEQIDKIYVDDSVSEKNNNHSKNKILEFIKKIKKHK